MYLKDLSLRLQALNTAAATDSRDHASLIVREMVNPLESVNNLAYLLSLSAQNPEQDGQLIALLQSQLASLNEVVQTTLNAATVVPVPGLAKGPRV